MSSLYRQQKNSILSCCSTHTVSLNIMPLWFPSIFQSHWRGEIPDLWPGCPFDSSSHSLSSSLTYFCLKNCLLWSHTCWTVIYCNCTYLVSDGLFVDLLCFALMVSWQWDCCRSVSLRGKLPSIVCSGEEWEVHRRNLTVWQHHACTMV